MRGKFAVAGIVALLLVAVAGGSALSAPPDGLESYDAGATTTAFALGLGPEAIAGGLTLAELTSDGPVSLGDGAALLLPGAETEGAESTAPGGPATNEDCAIDEELPEPIDAAGLEIGCVRTTAPDTEHSTSASESTTISVLGSELTDQLVDALLAPVVEGLAPLLEGADELVGAICEGLGGVLGQDCEVSDAVDQVVDGLRAGAIIATIAVAPGGSSTSADDADGVVAEAISNGVVIKVLPNEVLYGTDELGKPNGALTIRVAPTVARAEADPDSGDITTSASVGLVELEAGDVTNNALGELLGIDDDDALLNTLTDGLNDLIGGLADANALACGVGSPLEDIICLSAAQASTDLSPGDDLFLDGFDYGDGTLGARATALGLRLLSAAQEGGLVSLYLSDAFAAVNAVPAQDPPPTTEPTEPPVTIGELPRTGGSSTPLLALVAGLAGAFLVMRMRGHFRASAT